MLIEIRSASGERIAAANDISGAIKQLVSLCCRYRDIVEDYHRKFSEIAVLQVDLSATAKEHEAVYSAGWNAAREAIRQIVP